MKAIVTMFICMAVAMAALTYKEIFHRQKGKEGEHE